MYHSRTKVGQAELAAASFPSILRYYEILFDLPFPLAKLDMAAIPDFSAGAMENWGLVMYREAIYIQSPPPPWISIFGGIFAHSLM